MKKIFIIFLFIIFSSSFSLAKDDEKITVEEIENIFFENKRKYPIINVIKKTRYSYSNSLNDSVRIARNKREKKKKYYESIKKRAHINKSIVQCMHHHEVSYANSAAYDNCRAKVVRAVLSRSERAQKKWPGDIFFALAAIHNLLGVRNAELYRNIMKSIKYNEGDNPIGMVCTETIRMDERVIYSKYAYCYGFRKSTYKKVEKFKKDPSNEKVLGKKIIKYIKNVRAANNIREMVGITSSISEGYSDSTVNDRFLLTKRLYLLGDMLNAAVADVKKNNIRPDLKQRRVLLKKYSLILSGIKKKLDEDNYKSIDKDVSKLSKAHKKLKALKPTTHKLDIEIDEAVNTIFDTNKLIETSTLKAKDNKEEKSLALASINFMESLIDSILSVIPEKYYAITKELSPDLFNDEDLAELEVIIDTMMKKNNVTRSAEWTESMDIINKYINTSDVLKTLNNLGMENSISRAFTQDTAAEIANKQIRDNLDKEIFKDVKKIVQNMDKNDLDDLSKEASEIAKEVSNVAKETSSSSEPWSIGDKKFGNFTLKQIIHASRTHGR